MSADSRRAPYDASRRSLYRPGEADDFFARDGPWSEAALCAELSRLAYCRDPDRRSRALVRVGLEERAFLSQGGTEALLIGSGERLFVAFRGTEAGERQDILDDLRVVLTAWGRGGRVHAGFQAALAASLAPQAQAYAFGSPRVGDSAFARTLEAGRIHRFVNCCDVVCQVPPELLGYVHVGRLRYIGRDGVVLENATSEEIEGDRRRARGIYRIRYAWKLWRNVATRALADHAPVNYVSAL